MSEVISVPEYLNLRLLSPEEVLFEARVLWVQVPLHDGLLGIWPGHAPLVASTARGRIRFNAGQGAQELAVGNGILRVGTEECIILVGLLTQGREGTGQDKGALFADLEDALSDSLSEAQIKELQED